MTTADEHRIMLRRADAVKLRVRGHSYSQIAEKLGISKAQAHIDVTAALRESAAERGKDLEESRELELERLDNAIRKVTDILERELGFAVEGVKPEELSALLGDTSELVLKAADRLVKLSSERSKLLGLYAPTKQELSGNDGGPIQVSPEAAAAKVREIFGSTGSIQEAPADDESLPSDAPGS